jgi:hypothetical protein
MYNLQQIDVHCKWKIWGFYSTKYLYCGLLCSGTM